jgi:hypothetical protein
VDFREEHFGEWKESSRAALLCWVAVFVLFLVYALAKGYEFLFIDYVNLMIHEMGHPLFSTFGYTMMILGGTLFELIVPAACAGYFFWRREIAGFAFSVFWFFENFLYIGVYMADARAQTLPLVGSGDHDWAILFGHWGLMAKDTAIGETARAIGWIGMLAVVGWLAWRVRLASATYES